ncbi:universal stress protein [Hymenobacter busanensis]|uniref:Universal stress protein n=1 Tax=Hymenobacter busanensis TaxID=2607656 RepID=A0A7L4ZSF0_9BACT|nr:universal stress protein [Hymenobacter busanensis]KAA9327649.1 universal stress protein [Hymenobacter busanensis]QHJ06011.1 universal stress protein [Hymenobacter busanensis]
MQHLLVPTDFSAEAHHAFEVALQLAHRTDSRLTLLHVVDSPGATGMVSTGGALSSASINSVFMVQLLQATRHRMQTLLAEASRLQPGVLVHDMVETGPVEAAILDVVKQQQIDLVVVGAHEHRAGFHLFTPDSVAERLVRLAPCPVLTVKHPAPRFDVHSIVFASDFAPEADAAAPQLRQLRAAFPEATLHLLDVVAAPEEFSAAIERIHAFAARHHFEVYEPDVYSSAEVRTGIPRYAQQAHADLVVMLTHGRTGLRHLLQSSIAESVAVKASAPVLTFHPHA